MDKFLDQQRELGELEAGRHFSVNPEMQREKLVDSIPTEPKWGAFLLLEHAVALAHTGKVVRPTYIYRREKYAADRITVSVELGGCSLNRPRAIVEALRTPFQGEPEVGQLGRAIYLFTAQLGTVTLTWRGGRLTLKTGLDIPDALRAPEESDSLKIVFKIKAFTGYVHFTNNERDWARYLRDEYAVMPKESFSTKTQGWFDYRTKPFSLIQSYVPSEGEPSLKLNIWDGSYLTLDDRTVLLAKVPPNEYRLFSVTWWRSGYGRPVFLHHNHSGKLELGPVACKAVFWVEASDAPAQVTLSCGDHFYSSIPLQGPPGLQGRVVWPSLKRDLWGVRLVRDDEYDKALAWCEQKAQELRTVLSENLNSAVDALMETTIVAKHYQSEVRRKATQLWGG